MIMPRREHDIRAIEGAPEDRTLRRFWSKVAIGGDNECWPWTAKARRHGGYGAFAIWEGATWGAHRLAWIFHNQAPIPAGLVVRHTCDNPPCCNPRHLVLGSQLDNIADMHSRGRASGGRVPRPGEANPNAKLTQPQAEQIVTRRRDGESITSLAAEFGISKAQASRIANGKRWALAKVALPEGFREVAPC